MSAQSFLGDMDLNFSPFLIMIEKWISGLYPTDQKHVKMLTHTCKEQLSSPFDSLETKFDNEDIYF